ncbi:MAG: hypothetical protein HY363_03945 [Candidatus Aenigmarchaeota archaeon]|nr:hypothetical protein [Candidatus Aenigmarchaeota archaeon]
MNAVNSRFLVNVLKWQWKVNGGRATAWPVGRGNYNNRFDVNGYNYNNRASRE